MVLREDNTLEDARDPVILTGLQQENVPVTVNELQNAGSKTDIASSDDQVAPETGFETAVQRIEYLQSVGWISAEEATRRKAQLYETGGATGASNIATGNLSIELRYNQPNIEVTSSARYKEHQTIGGPVIRQKLGNGNKEVTISGVCTTIEAKVIDELRREETITILSHRYSGEVQVASTNTSPLEDGGAMNLEGFFTHTFGISCVEVE